MSRDQEDLKDLLAAMKSNKDFKIKILGNTQVYRDELPTTTLDTPAFVDDVNRTMRELQLYRAKSVRSYLIRNGILPNRMSIGNGSIRDSSSGNNASTSIVIIK